GFKRSLLTKQQTGAAPGLELATFCLQFGNRSGGERMTRLSLVALLLVAASVIAEDATDSALLEKAATELAACCPVAKPDDSKAYDSASQKLADSKLLQGICNETVLWGGHTISKPLNPEEGHMLTEFDPRVWRSEYLAGFMFPGAHSVERKEG